MMKYVNILKEDKKIHLLYNCNFLTYIVDKRKKYKLCFIGKQLIFFLIRFISDQDINFKKLKI